MPSKRSLKVLVLEPANQQLPFDSARPNGALGPAYLVGALRRHGIEADYLDATVGWDANDLQATFYNHTEQSNGTVRYGMDPDRMAEIIANYDIVATSSIFSVQTRMHFEAAATAKRVAERRGRDILVVSGGVNARALREHFLSNGFDIIALGEGEKTIVDIAEQCSLANPDFSEIDGIAYRQDGRTIVRPVVAPGGTPNMDALPFPALDSMPLDIYRDLGVPHAGLPSKDIKFAPMQTSRGCQDKCTFCHISLEKQQTNLVGNIGFLRAFSNERIAEEVNRAVDLGIRRLYFEDDNLFYNKKRLVELVPYLRRDGLEYSDVNGANLRFLLKKNTAGAYIIDTDFINSLTDFGLRELMLPFESRSNQVMKTYASGKYDPDEMDSAAIVRALKKADISICGNFMIGFHDEPWESVLQTKEYARELLAEGLDSVGFMIPVPYPGSVDFERVMQDSELRADFDRDPLAYTDRMQPRGLPLFETEVPGERLQLAVREFWQELNSSGYTASKMQHSISSHAARLAS